MRKVQNALFSHQTSINCQRSNSKSPTHHKMSTKSPKIQSKRSPAHHRSVMIANDLYLKYQGDHLCIAKQKENNRPKNSTKQAKHNRNLTLIQADQHLRERQDFSQFKNRINILEAQCQRIVKSRKNKSIIQKQPKIQIVDKPLQAQKIVATEKNVYLKIFPSQLPFGQILNIEEQNFFAKKRNRQYFNIFMLLEKPNDPMFLSGWERLQIQRFCHDSIVHNNNKKFNEDLSKNLSPYARILAVKNDSKSVPNNFKLKEYDLIQAIQNIGMNQILAVASGQVAPEIIKNLLDKQYVTRQIIQEEVQSKITYEDDERRKNKKSIIQSNQRDAEFKYHKQLKTTKQQQQMVEKQQKKNNYLRNS